MWTSTGYTPNTARYRAYCLLESTPIYL
jgi:hypothetical protein